MNEPVLCYVDGSWAWFTTQELSEQWGDDWNDAPYEHNAGSPYFFDKHDEKQGKTPWTIVQVAFNSSLEAPTEWHRNSPYSVQDINNKAIPWLQTGKYGPKDKEGNPVQIWAGTTLSEFIRLIEITKGTVYLDEETWKLVSHATSDCEVPA